MPKNKSKLPYSVKSSTGNYEVLQAGETRNDFKLHPAKIETYARSGIEPHSDDEEAPNPAQNEADTAQVGGSGGSTEGSEDGASTDENSGEGNETISDEGEEPSEVTEEGEADAETEAETDDPEADPEVIEEPAAPVARTTSSSRRRR